MSSIITNIKPVCRGCGTCCRKGGPALHTKDSFLFEENLLKAADVCTIRAGELVRDTHEDRLAPLPEELVKIAPNPGARPDDWTCRFLTSANRCFLHGKHPAECRALYCEAPQALLALSEEPRLTREMICKLVNAPAWWPELIKTHEERVNYADLTQLAEKIDDDADVRRAFLETVEFDRAFRDLVVEKEAAPAETLNFLFGRPLLQTIIMFGLDARKSDTGYSLVRLVK